MKFYYLFFSIINIFVQCQIIEINMEKKPRSTGIFEKFFLFSQEIDINKNMMSDLFTINLKMGSNNDEFNLVIDTGSTVLWLPSSTCYRCSSSIKKFETQLSYSYKNLSEPSIINYADGSYSKGYLSQDVVKLNMISSKLTFLLSYDMKYEIPNTSGIMGLGLDYLGIESSSIIKMLYENKQIKKQMFSQKLDLDKGKLYIGDFAPEILNDKVNFTNCSIPIMDNYNGIWACKIDAYYSGYNYNFSKVIPVQRVHVLFDSGTNFIILGKNYEKPFVEHFFGDLLENGYCFKKESYYFCNSFLYNLNFPPFYFLINDIAYKIDGSDLFFDLIGYLQLKVIFIWESDLWILGQPFLQKYHVVYNMEDRYLGFHGGKKYNAFNYVDNDLPIPFRDSLTLKFYIFIFFIAILIIGLIIWYIKKRIIQRRSARIERNILNEELI